MEHRDELAANSVRSAAMRWGRWLAALILVALLVASLVVTGRDVDRAASGTWDETIYLQLGRQLQTANDLKPLAALGVAPLPVRLVWDADALAPIEAPANDPGVYRERLTRARRNAVWRAGVPLVLGVFAWVAASHGLVAGVVAAALITFSPNIVAHATLATTDVSFAAAFVGCLAALVLAVRRQTWWSATLVAIGLGVALAAKYSSLILFLLAAVLFIWHHRQRRLAVDVLALAGGLLVAWAAHGWASAPAIVDDGTVAGLIRRALAWSALGDQAVGAFTHLPVPIYVRGIAAQLYLDRAGQEAFLLGQTAQHGWWYYFPVALSLKSTPVELFAFGAFGVFAVRALLRGDRNPHTRVLIAAAAIFAAASMFSHRDLGIRYVLPVVIIMTIAAVGWTADRLRRHPWLAAGIAAVAVAAQFASFRSIAPDYLAYFNGLAGGPSRGYTRLVDSNLDWGQDLPRLAEWLRARGTDRVMLAYFGSAPPAAYGIQAETIRRASASAPPEWLAISATLYQGVFMCGDPFSRFRAIQPDGRVGYTMMMYATGRDEVRIALAAARDDPCLQ